MSKPSTASVIWFDFQLWKLWTLGHRSKSSHEIRRYLMDKAFWSWNPVPQRQAVLLPVHLSHHNAQNIDMVLRIATEFHLKRLIVGGMSEFMIGQTFVTKEWILTIQSSYPRGLPLHADFKISRTWLKALSNMLLFLAQWRWTWSTTKELRSRSTNRLNAFTLTPSRKLRALISGKIRVSEEAAAWLRKKVPLEKHFTEVGYVINAFFEEFVEETLIQPTLSTVTL